MLRIFAVLSLLLGVKCFYLHGRLAMKGFRPESKRLSNGNELIFGGIKLFDPVAKSMRAINILNPSPIQQEALVPLTNGTSCMLHAQTGSGKTIAYLLPILKRIFQTDKTPFKAMIIVPTRELAIQVISDIASLVDGRETFAQLCFDKNVEDLIAPIIVGTPYKFVVALKGNKDKMDHINTLMRNLEYVVIDEIDRLIPVPGKYATLEKKEAIRKFNNPAVELLRFLVGHKELQLMHQNSKLPVSKREHNLPVQFVAASATVGRTLLREVNKILYTYSIAHPKIGEKPEVVHPGMRGALKVIRPEGVSVDHLASHGNPHINQQFALENSESGEESGSGQTISRLIGVPITIEHIPILLPEESPEDARDRERQKLNVRHLKILADYWMATHGILKKGLLFMPTINEVPTALQMFRKWRIKESVDLQQALGLLKPSSRGLVNNVKVKADSSLLIFNANARGVGGKVRRERNLGGNDRELFIAPLSSARGLHIQDLDCVMIFQLPETMDQYLHMSGRTGRLSNTLHNVNKKYVSVSLVNDAEAAKLKSWQTPLGIVVNSPSPLAPLIKPYSQYL